MTKTKLSNYLITDKSFYKKALLLIIPVVLQNATAIGAKTKDEESEDDNQ